MVAFNDRRELFLARLEEIAREYEEPLTGWERVKSRLLWENWEVLRAEAVSCAREEIRRRKWRGAKGGVVPGTADAEDIAGYAIREMLEGRCRLAAGFTRERLLDELKRVVRRQVRVLHKQRETAAMRNEWDARPSEGEEGEPKSAFAGMTEERQEAGRAEEQRERFEAFLKDEPEVLAIFRCLWSGMVKPKEIAEQLGIEEAAVVRGRKKLARKIEKFRNGKDF